MNRFVKYGLIIILVSVLAFAIHHRYVFTAPNCVKVDGLNRVRVVDANIGFLPARCNTTEIRAYLKQYDFEYVGTENLTDNVYVR